MYRLLHAFPRTPPTWSTFDPGHLQFPASRDSRLGYPRSPSAWLRIRLGLHDSDPAFRAQLEKGLLDRALLELLPDRDVRDDVPRLAPHVLRQATRFPGTYVELDRGDWLGEGREERVESW